ncbi:MAG: helix-turn-helix domain-containing protein [Clostridia bacterium]|nr:helix-turn-helix domain-containing protein [Clostridia bacterium]
MPKGTRYHLNRSHIKEPLRFGDTLLYQIGRLHCAEDLEIKVHGHLNWFELTVVTDGRGTVSTNGVAVPVERGDIYLSFPGDFHGILSDKDKPLKYDFFAFNTVSPDLGAELEELTRTALSADRRVFRDERVRTLVADAIAEIGGTDGYAERILTVVMEQIILYVLRNFRTMQVQKRNFVGKQEELCYRMMHYIDTHIYTMQGLSDLAQAMCYHYSYLSEVFCKVTSETLLHYYRTRRLEAARLLLSEERLSVGEVADLLHYASIYTFSRAFKEAFGISPARYRRESTEKKEGTDEKRIGS